MFANFYTGAFLLHLRLVLRVHQQSLSVPVLWFP